jgi:SOS-response transcriptional repressor LexA
MRDSLASRLKAARKAAGMNQEELEAASGVSQSDISKIERGKTLNPTGILDLARALGVNPFWLKTGEGDMHHEHLNVQSVTTKGRVPLISWVIAGNLQEIQDMYQPGEADEWIETSETKPGKGSFALRVTGDSMTSPYPGDISFPDGTVIVVDPTRACDAGDFVIAKDVATQQATFKRLVHDGGRWFLKPLNPAYPTMEIDDPAVRTIGRVIESHTRRKL